jgi:hypothetical protein
MYSRICRLGIALLVNAFALTGEAGAAESPPSRAPGEAFAPLLQFAAKLGVPTKDFDPATARDELKPDDAVTVLVSQTEKKSEKQWLMYFVVTEPSEQDKRQPPPRPVHLYTSTGRSFHFDGTRTGVAIRVLGPCRQSDPASWADHGKEIWTGFPVHSEFLRYGFVDFCRAFLPLHDHAPERFLVNLRDKPFADSEVAENRRALASSGVTVEQEQRIVESCLLSLPEFLVLAAGNSEMRDIVLSVADISWWGLLRAATGNSQIICSPQLADIEKVASDNGTETFLLPVAVSLNGRPLISLRLTVTASRLPLRLTAGVTKLEARRPDGKGPVVRVTVLAGRCAPVTTVASNGK